MSRKYTLRNALEDFQDDVTDVQQAPPVSADNVEIAEDNIGDDINASQDLGDDISSLVTASESLESLADALSQDLFPGHAASMTEIRSVNLALESYGLESDTTDGDAETKASLKDRVVAGAKKIWAWLVKVVTNIGTWIGEVFNRMARPMLTYEKRMDEVISASKKTDTLSDVNGEKYIKGMSYKGSTLDGLKRLGEFCSNVSNVNNTSFTKISEEIGKIATKQSDGSGLKATIVELHEGLSKFYGKHVKDGFQYTDSFIGEWTFKLNVLNSDKFEFDHGVDQAKGVDAPPSLEKTELEALCKQIKHNVGVWRELQKSVKEMNFAQASKNFQLISKIPDFLANKVDELKMLKEVSRSYPKILKNPVIDCAMVITKVTSAAVSFAEAHVAKSMGDRVSEAGDSIKSGASRAGNAAMDAGSAIKNKATSTGKSIKDGATSAAKTVGDKFSSLKNKAKPA